MISPEPNTDVPMAQALRRDRAYSAAVEWLHIGDAPEAYGSNRAETAAQVAAKLYRFGVSPQQCGDLLAEWNEDYCSPSLEADEIGKILDSAPDNRQQPTAHTADLNAAPPSTKGVLNAPAGNSKLEAALDHARRGFSVFPLITNAKVPAIANWQNLATTDATQIGAWWSAEPNANIGISTAGLFVADVDPHKGGDATLKTITLCEDLPLPLAA